MNLLDSNTKEADDVLVELSDDADAITDDEEDNLICEKNLNADNYRLCKAKAAHDAVFGKIDNFLVKKTLRAMEAPHLDTKSLIAKFDLLKQLILMSPRSWPNRSITQFMGLFDRGYVKESYPK